MRVCCACVWARAAAPAPLGWRGLPSPSLPRLSCTTTGALRPRQRGPTTPQARGAHAAAGLHGREQHLQPQPLHLLGGWWWASCLLCALRVRMCVRARVWGELGGRVAACFGVQHYSKGCAPRAAWPAAKPHGHLLVLVASCAPPPLCPSPHRPLTGGASLHFLPLEPPFPPSQDPPPPLPPPPTHTPTQVKVQEVVPPPAAPAPDAAPGGAGPGATGCSSQLSFVDLAGSERAGRTKNTGSRLR